MATARPTSQSRSRLPHPPGQRSTGTIGAPRVVRGADIAECPESGRAKRARFRDICLAEPPQRRVSNTKLGRFSRPIFGPHPLYDSRTHSKFALFPEFTAATLPAH